jgi:hypothetical protein
MSTTVMGNGRRRRRRLVGAPSMSKPQIRKHEAHPKVFSKHDPRGIEISTGEEGVFRHVWSFDTNGFGHEGVICADRAPDGNVVVQPCGKMRHSVRSKTMPKFYNFVRHKIIPLLTKWDGGEGARPTRTLTLVEYTRHDPGEVKEFYGLARLLLFGGVFAEWEVRDAATDVQIVHETNTEPEYDVEEEEEEPRRYIIVPCWKVTLTLHRRTSTSQGGGQTLGGSHPKT